MRAFRPAASATVTAAGAAVAVMLIVAATSPAAMAQSARPSFDPARPSFDPARPSFDPARPSFDPALRSIDAARLAVDTASLHGRPRQQLPHLRDLPLLTECGALVHAGEAVGFVGLPQGDLFCPRLADPKEPRTFISVLRGRSPGEAANGEFGPLMPLETTIGAIGIGDALGLARWGGPRPGDGVQLSIAASVFAQFDLEAASFDLINADYVVALPLTMRRGAFSARLRLYHQSSHLGDEFLIRDQPERINLAFESLELILSHGLGPLRVYLGGEVLFNRQPEDLDPRVAHAGLEARAATGRPLGFVAALDVKATEGQDWRPAWSARAGIEARFARDPGHPPRTLGLLGEFYDGPSPYGQFYREQLRYWGVGLHLTL